SPRWAGWPAQPQDFWMVKPCEYAVSVADTPSGCAVKVSATRYRPGVQAFGSAGELGARVNGSLIPARMTSTWGCTVSRQRSAAAQPFLPGSYCCSWSMVQDDSPSTAKTSAEPVLSTRMPSGSLTSNAVFCRLIRTVAAVAVGCATVDARALQPAG